ncbi:MAG: DUF4276 family protein [Acidobacteria bacterium]|nr:DUF4276 family protein [Acidobacteriota bacterium]
MKIGLFVEGRSDKGSIPHLIKGLVPNAGVEPRTATSGDMLSPEKMEGYLIPLTRQHPDVQKVLIVRDCECTDPSVLRPLSARVQSHLSQQFPSLIVRFVLAVHALEAWLMADRTATGQVLGPNVARQLPANPELECRPRQLLEQLSDKFNHVRDNERIAGVANVSAIAACSPSFAQLQTALKDP